MRFYNSSPVPDGFEIKSVTLRQRQDGWYASVRIEDKTVPDYAALPLKEVRSLLGGDWGITKLVHQDDGYQFEHPRFGINKRTKQLLKVRQRRINRKVKGSKRRKKASKKVGRLPKKMANRSTILSMVGGKDYHISAGRCYRDRGSQCCPDVAAL
ncbi:transposase, IS605 OrfB family protein [Microseira wollei NIES-4236]|uniref:Transposase, IS605 OrfB family protein n=2 Tax=Microseira wollei TaxID=467598 RepID=A0AAV3XTB7_9CYAN|nr:transposase, IS605 OrfB family protein [Microseira wollei NIES-4236]